MSFYECPKCGGIPGVTFCCTSIAENKPMTTKKPEPVAFLHSCRKKPELKELLFTRKNEQLKAKGYFPKPLYTESDMEAYAQARVDEVLDSVIAECNAAYAQALVIEAHSLYCEGRLSGINDVTDRIRALKGKV